MTTAVPEKLYVGKKFKTFSKGDDGKIKTNDFSTVGAEFSKPSGMEDNAVKQMYLSGHLVSKKVQTSTAKPAASPAPTAKEDKTSKPGA
jgi:hypothetical protein